MWILKVWNRIKPKVSVPQHSNLVNEASMLLLKGVSNNFAETMFFLRDVIKIISDQ